MKYCLLLVLIFSIFIVGCTSTGSQLQYHSCKFDSSTLDLNCSSELRILMGYERVLTEEPIDQGDGTIAYFYDVPIYSETSNSNINEIYKSKSDVYITNTEGEKYRQCANCDVPSDLPAQDYFTNFGLFQFRKIDVLDVETDETFNFYVSESKIYDIEEDNSIEFTIDLCNENNNTVCMPDQYWRCINYDSTAKACQSLVSFIQNTGDLYLCYELKKEDLLNYCLEKTS